MYFTILHHLSLFLQIFLVVSSFLYHPCISSLHNHFFFLYLSLFITYPPHPLQTTPFYPFPSLPPSTSTFPHCLSTCLTNLPYFTLHFLPPSLFYSLIFYRSLNLTMCSPFPHSTSLTPHQLLFFSCITYPSFPLPPFPFLFSPLLLLYHQPLTSLSPPLTILYLLLPSPATPSFIPFPFKHFLRPE